MLDSGMQLANGLKIQIEDRSRTYFGDYHLVRIILSANIRIAACAGLTAEERALAAELFGESVSYRKSLEKMGVGSADVVLTKETLLQNFAQNSLPYLQAPDFSTRFVRAEINRKLHRRH